MDTSKARCSLALVVALNLVSGLALAAPIKVACFGDPSTHSDQLQPAQEYPAKLQVLLGAGYEVKNFGDCCGTVLRASRYTNTHGSHVFTDAGFQLDQSIAYGPDIVVIGGIGKHDMDETGGFGPQSSIVAAEFEADYELLVKRYLDLPKPPKLFVSTPVPYPEGSMAPADAKPVTTIMLPAVKKTAAAHQLPIIDLYATFSGKKLLFKDDYHLSNDAGLQTEAETVYAAIKNAGPPGMAGAGSGGMSGASTGGVSSAGAGGGAAGGGLNGGTSGGASSGASSGGVGGTGAGGVGGQPAAPSASGSDSGGASPALATGGGQSGGNALAPQPAATNDAGCSVAAPRSMQPGAAWLWALFAGLAVGWRRRNRAARHAISGSSWL